MSLQSAWRVHGREVEVKPATRTQGKSDLRGKLSRPGMLRGPEWEGLSLARSPRQDSWGLCVQQSPDPCLDIASLFPGKLREVEGLRPRFRWARVLEEGALGRPGPLPESHDQQPTRMAGGLRTRAASSAGELGRAIRRVWGARSSSRRS